MSSSSSSSTATTRPVPRRESPWGRPEGDHRQPKAHRCNDRAEDFVQACFEGNPFKTVPGPFKLFYRCMRSKPGESQILNFTSFPPRISSLIKMFPIIP
ncbi:hypothetical protein MKX01_014179 [Papaver californicum]|nr:hypothetical protein MKX01_014179 [Papaver californicum]